VWVLPAPVGRALPTLRLRPLAGAMPRVLGPSWEREGAEPQADAAVPEVAGDEAVRDAAPDVENDAAPCQDAVLVEALPESAESFDEPHDAVLAASPPQESPFARYIAALAALAAARGATRAAAALAGLLEHGRIAPGAFDETTLKGLISRRILAPSGTHASAEFRATSQAWRGVLDGTTADLDACGAATLDMWSAELVAAALDAPSSAVPDLRRELRRAGVAAFGLLAVA